MPIPPPLVAMPWLPWPEAPRGETRWGERLAGFAMSLLQSPAGRERPQSSEGTATLATAVAGIVAVAAQRARLAGDLANLRALIERALDTADPSTEAEEDPALPRIADADPLTERQRLLALAARQDSAR